jgi:hypothetical protein
MCRFAQYEKLRLPRTSRMQAMSAADKTRLHLPDGPAQQESGAKWLPGNTYPSIKAMAWVYKYGAAVPAETGHLNTTDVIGQSVAGKSRHVRTVISAKCQRHHSIDRKRAANRA